jgi:uncharacterized membrane protein YfcA
MRRELAGTRPWLLVLLGPSLGGGLIGALLLLLLPASFFEVIVPWLLLTAALLYLAQPHLGRLLKREGRAGLPGAGLCAVVVLFQLLVGLYGGYFGAGIGILMISSLSLMGLGELRRIYAVKNVLAAAINGISVVVFVWKGPIFWTYALAMAATAILGGLCGARLGKVLPRSVLRWFIILIGLGLAAYYFYKQATSGGPAPQPGSSLRPWCSQTCC